MFGVWGVALRKALWVPLRRLARGPKRPSWSTRYEIIAETLQADAARIAAKPAQWRREYVEKMARRVAWRREAKSTEVAAGRVRGVWFEPEDVDPQAPLLVYFHGGAYRFGSPHTHATLIAGLARLARVRAFAPRYRLAPEHPYPAALEDALAALEWLRAQGHTRLVLAGDSAGGNLVLAAMLRLRDEGAALPERAALLCPWVEMAEHMPSRFENAKYDFSTTDEFQRWTDAFLAGHDPRDPLVSPGRADLHGLPRLLVQVGSAEMLHDEVVAFAHRAREAGTEVWLSVYPDMTHDWQTLAVVGVPQAHRALEELAVFVRGD